MHLSEANIIHTIFHGDLTQDERESALAKFRNGSSQILLATDLAARGLDIPEIASVVHYQLPQTEDAFIHRNGRTARMHADGKVFLLVSAQKSRPSFIPNQIAEKPLEAIKSPLQAPLWETIYISKGKKDKISKGDIVGFLIQQGKLEKNEVGIIEVKDFHTYVAVNRSKTHEVLKRIQHVKIKKQGAKIEVAR
jgi:ATP-independent RNA helicase DbpA